MTALSTCTYRVWVYTSTKDAGGHKGQLSICLGGTLGSKWLMRVDAAIPPEELFRAGEQCEFFQEAEDVGSLHSLGIEYGTTVSDHSLPTNYLHAPSDEELSKVPCAPWYLSHVIVRNSTSGVVSHFPITTGEPLTDPSQILSLEPRLTWHEDQFGNTAEQAPPVPVAGRWYWPVLSLPQAVSRGDSAANTAEQELIAEYGEIGISLLDTICREELLPVIDQAAQEIRVARTPGTFTYDCTQAVLGVPVTGAANRSIDDLRRKNLVLQGEVDQLEKEREKVSPQPILASSHPAHIGSYVSPHLHQRTLPCNARPFLQYHPHLICSARNRDSWPRSSRRHSLRPLNFPANCGRRRGRGRK